MIVHACVHIFPLSTRVYPWTPARRSYSEAFTLTDDYNERQSTRGTTDAHELSVDGKNTFKSTLCASVHGFHSSSQSEEGENKEREP